MPNRLVCLVLLCCCACDGRQADDLTPAERKALAHIERTPYLVVFSVQRVAEHELIVATRQGDDTIRYRIDSSDPEAAPSRMVRRLPSTGLHYSYDRNKPRGTFRAGR